MARLETLTWQQHVVTLRAETLEFGKTLIDCTTVSGEDLHISVDNFVWLSEDEAATRLCYNRLVPMSGVTGVKLVHGSTPQGIAKFRRGKMTLTVNKKYHKLHKDAPTTDLFDLKRKH